MKNILITVCFFLGAYYLISCTKGGNQDGFNGAIYSISANANSKLLVPPIDTTANGTLVGVFDEQSNIFTYTITWNDLWRDSIYSATLKKNVVTTTAQRDVLSTIKFYTSSTVTDSGKIVRSQLFASTSRSSNISFSMAGNIALSPIEKADLFANKWYVVLATQKFPKGIIRGQLITVKQ